MIERSDIGILSKFSLIFSDFHRRGSLHKNRVFSATSTALQPNNFDNVTMTSAQRAVLRRKKGYIAEAVSDPEEVASVIKQSGLIHEDTVKDNQV